MNAPDNLRDWYAGVAMQVFIETTNQEMVRAGVVVTKEQEIEKVRKAIAAQSFAMADEMMKARVQP